MQKYFLEEEDIECYNFKTTGCDIACFFLCGMSDEIKYDKEES